MKKFILGAAIALVATAAVAGNVAPPTMDTVVVIDQAATSSMNDHILPPLMFLLLVAGSILL